MIKEPPAHNVQVTLDPIFSGYICPYCGQPTVLTDSAEVYNGVSYGPIYICRPCNAFVGCHNGTTIALGRLADARLREAKKAAHSAFDRLWNRRTNPAAPMSRHKAYSWLSETLGIDREYTHIGMFDIDTCNAVVAACQQFLNNQ